MLVGAGLSQSHPRLQHIQLSGRSRIVAGICQPQSLLRLLPGEPERAEAARGLLARAGGNRSGIGIACTRFNETVRYWDADIVLEDTPDDEPAQLTWEAVDVPADSGSSPNRLLGLGIGAVVLAAVVVAVGLVRHRRPQ